MTQAEVEAKIRSYIKKRFIFFDYDEMIQEIASLIIGENFTEAKKTDYLGHLYYLFNHVKTGGKPLYDERNGKVICTTIRSDEKKFMAIHFLTIKKGLLKYYLVYFFIIDCRKAASSAQLKQCAVIQK